MHAPVAKGSVAEPEGFALKRVGGMGIWFVSLSCRTREASWGLESATGSGYYEVCTIAYGKVPLTCHFLCGCVLPWSNLNCFLTEPFGGNC